MKKQLFFILLLSVILIGGFSSSAYAQLDPRAVTCLTSDHLHPVPGQPYTYEVSVPNVNTPTFTWFVTQNPQFIQIVGGIPQLNYTVPLGAQPQTGGFIMDAGAGYATPPNGSANNTLDITWKSFAYNPAQPVFLVVQAVGDNGVCSPNNLKVWKIEPLFAFTLDIDNLDDYGVNHTATAYGDNFQECISDIQSATYDPTAPEGIIYDFGSDTLYYEVVAANWYDRWQLSVQINGLASANGQTAQIDWANAPAAPRPAGYLSGLTWNVVVASATNATTHTSSVLVAPQNGTGAVDDEGESIIIRVIVDHNNLYEGIADEPITLAVDGVLAINDGTGNYVVGDPLVVGDIHTEAGGSPSACPWYDGFENDESLQTIMRRPDIQPVTPADPFLPAK